MLKLIKEKKTEHSYSTEYLVQKMNKIIKLSFSAPIFSCGAFSIGTAFFTMLGEPDNEGVMHGSEEDILNYMRKCSLKDIEKRLKYNKNVQDEH